MCKAEIIACSHLGISSTVQTAAAERTRVKMVHPPPPPLLPMATNPEVRHPNMSDCRGRGRLFDGTKARVSY